MTGGGVDVQAAGPRAAVDYDAPFVLEKLCRERIVDTEEEAALLFREVKRYLVLAQDSTRSWQMYSLHVDDAWHQFVLFTTQYTDFCLRFFRRCMHHAPSNSPASGGEVRPAASFNEFRDRYADLFGEPLPDILNDARMLTLRRRLVNDGAGHQRVRREGGLVAHQSICQRKRLPSAIFS